MESPTLVSVEDVRERGGLADVVDLNDRVHEALKLTTRRLATQTRSEFSQKTVTDRFVIFATDILPGPLVKLKLSQGFVDEGVQAVVINKANTMKALRTGDSTLVDAVTYDVQVDKGVIVIEADEPTIPGAIEVIYAAGFATTTKQPYGEVYQAIPEWLFEAAVQWGLQTYDWLGDSKRTTRKLEKELEYGLIESHIRYFGDTLDPSVSL